MTKDGRVYARFYYLEFIRDYPAIYQDDAALSTWLRLLVHADQVWPMVPELPRSVRPGPLRKLVDAKLVTVTGVTYAVKGQAAERARRSNAGKAGAAVRWDSERNANASADAMPSSSSSRETPPPPTGGGRRSSSTNPRAVAARAATVRRQAVNAIKQRYYRGEITETAMYAEIEALP